MTINTPLDWLAATWDEGCTEVASFADKLGMPIDEGIFDTVVALNLLGMTTYQSCEGHLDHGCPCPWITLIDVEQAARTLEQWQALCKLQAAAQATSTVAGTLAAHDAYITARNTWDVEHAQWKRSNGLLEQVEEFLGYFYANRDASPVRLVAYVMNPAHVRIEAGCESYIRKLPTVLKASYLERSRVEMQEFTAFLKRQIGGNSNG